MFLPVDRSIEESPRAEHTAATPPLAWPMTAPLRASAFRADALLLLVAALWGAGFVAQKHAMGSMGPFAFNAARYTIGVGLLAAPVYLRRKSAPITRRTIESGVLLGVVMWAAAGLQQVGIVSTNASRSAFLTGLYVLIVPAIGVLFRQRITAGHIAGGVLAVIGLSLLGIGGDTQAGLAGLLGGFTTGDGLVLGCAVLWALHVVLTGHFAPGGDPLTLAWAQFITVAALSGVASLVSKPISDAGLLADLSAGLSAGWFPLLYSGVFVIAIAFTLQIIAQKDAPPTHAAVLMSLEAVFGAGFGVLLLGESLSPWEITGCVVMFAGMLVSQVHRGERTALERIEQHEPI